MKSHISYRVFFLSLLLVVLGGFSHVAHAQSVLFEAADGISPQGTTAPDYVIRGRTVTADLALLQNGAAETITLNLFDDTALTVNRTRTSTNPAVNGYVWSGTIADLPGSVVKLSVVDDVLIGEVRFDQVDHFTIRYDGTHQQITQFDPALREAMPFDHDHFGHGSDPQAAIDIEQIEVAMQLGRESAAAQRSAAVKVQMPVPGNGRNFCVNGNETGDIIDLLIAYTDDARATMGGTAAMQAFIANRIDDMNTANMNSIVDFTWQLVGTYETNYAESGSTSTDLGRLEATADGFMDDVHSQRDLVAADIVGLYIAEATSGNACGTASRPSSAYPEFEDDAFGVAALDYTGSSFCDDLTLSHEIGHVMGNAHEAGNTSGTTFQPYSYGYTAPSNNFHTIMSYGSTCGNCPQINYWSNPNVTYMGEAAGSSTANNALSMRLMAPTAANYRTSCYVPELVVNEADINTPGTPDAAEFIEIKNTYTSALNLDAYEVELVNGGNTVYDTIDLPNVTLAANDYYVICTDSAAVPNCDLVVTPATNWLQNGSPDAIAIRDTANSDQLVDTVSYGGDAADPYTEVTGTVSAISSANIGLSRLPDGADSNQNVVDWGRRCITPGSANIAASSGCAPVLAIDQAVSPAAGVVPGDTLNYSIVMTNSGSLFVDATLTDLFDASVSACTADLVQTQYDTTIAPVNLGTFFFDAADCVDAQGNADTLFNETGTAASTSPIECTVDVPIDAIVTTYDANVQWNPEPCSGAICWSRTVETAAIVAPNGTADSHTLTPSVVSTGTVSDTVIAQTAFGQYNSAGTWTIRLYDTDPANNGHRIITGNGRTWLTLYGYPASENRTPIPAPNLTNGVTQFLNVGDRIEASCAATIPASACNAYPSTVDATATGTGSGANNASDTVQTAVSCEVDLAVTKHDPVDPVLLTDGSLAWTIAVTNTGSYPAFNVLLTDTLPAEITLSSIASPLCSNVSGSALCSVPSLAPGATFATTVIGTIQPNTLGDVVNGVAVSAANADTNSANNADTETTTIVAADLAWSNGTSPIVFTPATAASYTIDLTNSGTAAATTSWTHANMSAYMTGFSCTDGSTSANNPAGATIVIPAGQTITYTCTGVPTEAVCSQTTIPLNFAASAPEDPQVSVTDSLAATPNCTPDIAVAVVANVAAAPVGESVLFTWYITNTGNVNLTNFSPTPAVSGIPSTLAPGQSASGTLSSPTLALSDNPTLTDSLAVSAATSYGPSVSDNDSDSVSVLTADLDLTQTVSGQPTQPNGAVTYQVLIENSGAAAATTTWQYADMTNLLDGFSCVRPGGSTLANPVSDNVTIPAGQSVTYTCTGTVSELLCGSQIVASSTASALEDPQGSVSDVDSAPVRCSPAVWVNVVASQSAVPVGDSVAFTWHITNTGDVALTNFTPAPAISGMPTTLAAGASASGTLSSQTLTLSDLPSVNDSLSVAADTLAGQTVSDDDSESVTVQTANLNLSQSMTGAPTEPNGSVTYRVTIANNGTAAATTTWQYTDMTDLVDGFSCVRPGGSSLSNPVSETVTIPAGDSFIYTCTGTMSEQACGSQVVASSAASALEDPQGSVSDFNSSIVVCNPALSVSLTASQPTAEIGDAVQFAWQVANTGDVALTNLNPSLTLAGLPAVLQPGQVVNGTVSGQMVAQADIPSVTESVSVAAASAVGTAVSDSASDMITVQYASLASSLTAGSTLVDVGDPVAWTITIDNSGNLTAVGLLTAAFPAAISNISCTPTLTNGTNSGVSLPVGQTTFSCGGVVDVQTVCLNPNNTNTEQITLSTAISAPQNIGNVATINDTVTVTCPPPLAVNMAMNSTLNSRLYVPLLAAVVLGGATLWVGRQRE